ncbi:MAG: enolase C-terminal domain-like protein [Bryobacteraceae bacterium]|nr:enolase C-terminal domain-like protein [Bryobacteraceae bacterium]
MQSSRRAFLQTAAGAASLIPLHAQEQAARQTRGLPALTIKDAKVIRTAAGGRYRWVFLKIVTSEPGLYGIGSANNAYQTDAVITALEKSLIPWLIGKDPNRIEDLWNSAQYRTYWRNGPVNNVVLSAMDMALWDIKGKRANMPVYDLLGGKTRDAVACYDHKGGNTKEAAAEAVQQSLETGYRHVRVQFGPGGYGGGGFYAKGEGNRPENGYQGPAFDEDMYVQTIPALFEYVRSKVGFGPKLLHDVHSHLSGINAVEFSRRMQPYQMFFVEDVLAPEQIDWYRQIRQVCSTPQAVGEVFSHPFETLPLVRDHLIDFTRCRIAAMGGLTPMRKIVNLCELNGVRTAFQEGGENDPVNQMAAYHLDISTPAFGIQEENHFPERVREILPGMGEIRKGYLYGSDKPGLGLDINETLAAKFPIAESPRGNPYGTDRALDGSVVRP